jgi:8-oxo-dGTP pyrophosphatase MutT (NUDIX family)
MEFNIIIDKIEDQLRKPLPGREHQYLMAPEIRLESGPASQTRNAGVLMCLFEGKNDLQIIFIKRTEYDGPHSGQISFPGGIFKDMDSGLLQTALRETQEETGINPVHARILGALSPLDIPVSNIIVHPYVAFYEREPVFRIDEKEVSYLILANLKSFLDPAARKKEKWNLRGHEIEVPFFQLDNNKIWGATAMMLCEFITIISRAGVYQ